LHVVLSFHLLQALFDVLEFFLGQAPQFGGKLIDLLFQVGYTDASGDFLVAFLGKLREILVNLVSTLPIRRESAGSPFLIRNQSSISTASLGT